MQPAPAPAPAPRRPLAVQVVATLLLAVGLPLAAVALVGWQLISWREDQASARGLTNVGVAVARRVEAHLGKHLDAVRAVAREAEDLGRFDGETMDRLLRASHEIYPGFHTMVAADASGAAFTGHPRVSAGGEAIHFPVPVGDREYFRRPMADGQPFVSPVFQGRGYGQHPIVAVSAPVLRDGKPVGVVEGSLDVAKLPLLEGLAPGEGFDVVVADGTGAVVYATPRTGLMPLQALAGQALGRAGRSAAGGTFRYQAGGEAFVAVEVAVGQGGWQVVVQQPERLARAASRRFLLTMLITLLSGVAVALLLGGMAARRAARVLVDLQASVRRFLSGEAPQPIELPRTAPREVADLVQDYEEMQRRLGKTLSGLLPVCAWCKRIRDDQSQWTSMEAYVRAHSSAEITHGMCPDCAARFDQAAHERAARRSDPA